MQILIILAIIQVDPQLRFLLELSYEALVDAGFTDLQKLKGSKTAVYVGSCFTDCHKGWLNDVKEITGYENTGCAQSMYANRLSFFYDFAGKSRCSNLSFNDLQCHYF